MKSFQEVSVKAKLIILISSSILFLGALISFTMFYSFYESISELNQKSLEHTKTFVSIRLEQFIKKTSSDLLFFAQNKTTEDSLIALQKSYNGLEKDFPNLDIEKINRDLIQYYESDFVNKINFEIPDVPSRQATSYYIPQSTSGRIAQQMFIINNPSSAKQKQKVNSSEKYENIPYIKTHKEIHPSFLSATEKFDLYDIFLISTDGEVIYSCFKEKDFGSNLIKGPFRNSGLARCFKESLNLNAGEVNFQDLSPYEPSYNGSAAFIGSPVFVQGEKKGVLVFQIPCDKAIQEIVSFNNEYEKFGLGKTGEAYFIGSDGIMRSNSRFIDQIKDPLVQKFKTTQGLFKVMTPEVEKALRGESGATYAKSYLGKDSLISYSPFKVLGGSWALVLSIDKQEIFETFEKLEWKIFIISTVSIGIVCLICIYAIEKIINKPLGAILKHIMDKSDVIKDGGSTLNQPIPVTLRDEIGNLAYYFNFFTKNLVDLILTTHKTVEIVRKSTVELVKVSQEVGSISSQQSAAVREIASTMEDCDASTKAIATKVTIISQQAEKMCKEVEQAFSYLEKNASQMNIIQNSNQSTIGELEVLRQQITSIWDIVNIINGIADQTKIIAFNAELEASSAGEAGKNFQIVATEIRRLADHTMLSTNKIKSKIHEVQSSSEHLIQSVENNTVHINEGYESSSKVREIFQSIRSSSMDSFNFSVEISQSIGQQVSAFEQIVLAIKQISENITHLAHLIELTNSNVNSLDTGIKELGNNINKYQL